MQNRDYVRRRIIAYWMIALLVVNLFSGIGMKQYVYAENDIDTVTLTYSTVDDTVAAGEPFGENILVDSSQIYIKYEFTSRYPEGTEYQYKVEKNGEETENQSLSVDPDTTDPVTGIISIGNDGDENVICKVEFLAKSETGDVLARSMVTFRLGTANPSYSAEASLGNVVDGVMYSKDEVKFTYEMDRDTTYTKLYREVLSWNGTGWDETNPVKPAETLSLEDKDDFYKKAEESFHLQEGGFSEGRYLLRYYLAKEDGSDALASKEVEFVFDKTAPVISVATNGIGNVGQRQIKYTVTSTENNPVGCDIKVHINRKTVDGDMAPDIKTYQPTAVNNEKDFDFTEDGIYEVYVTAVDAAGNEAVPDASENVSNGKVGEKSFVVDNSAPVLAFDGIDNGHHYNEVKTLNFLYRDLTVTAGNLNNAAPGSLYEITVERDGENLGTFVPDEWISDDSESCQSKVSCVFGNAETNSNLFGRDGTYTVTFKGKDSYGNQSATKEITFVIDTEITLKDLKVSHKDNALDEPAEVQEPAGDNATETVYYLKDDGKVSFQIDEKNYKAEAAKACVETSFNGGDFASREFPLKQMTKTPEVLVKDDYDAEGDYKVRIWAMDAAGNYAGKNGEGSDVSPDYIRHFVIDKTAPVFIIGGVAGNNSYCTTGTELTIVSEEKNPDFSKYKITVERTDNTGILHREEYAGSDGWETDGSGSDRYTRTLQILEEGNYKVTVTGADKSGNVGKNPQGEEAVALFRVDTTKPVIAWSGIRQGVYYSNSVQLRGSVTELNYEDTEAKIEMVRTLGGVEQESKTETLELKKITSEFLLSYEKEGEYTITITAKDGAGNEAEKEVIQFVIDKTAPQLSITGVRNGYMTKDNISIQLNATDYNHDFSKYKVEVVRSDVNGELDRKNYVFGESEWQKNGFTAVKTMTFSEEGKYEVVFDAVDKAGNEAATKKVSFYIDCTAPVISGIVYSDSNGILKEKYHNIYSNRAILVEFDVWDRVTGVNDKKVYVTVGKPEEKGSQLYIAHKTIGNSYYVYVPTDLSLAEFDSQITIWANDNVNNERNVLSTNLIFNTSKPSIGMNCDVDYTKWTNQDVTFNTTVSDEKSGLKEVVYKINNKTVKKVVFDTLTTSYSYELTAKETASKVTGYTVAIEVTNNCGTSATALRQVYIDKVKPKVSLSGISNGTHYNTNQIFTTDVKDVSYKDTKTTYVVTRTLDGKEYPVSMAVFRSDKQEDSCNRKVIKEGQYKIYAITTDSAGNRSVSNTLRFVIDKTAPKLSIDGVQNGAMSGSAVSVEFGCVESFYATNNVAIKVQRKLDGKTETREINGFPKNAKKTSMTQSFSEDGTYEITIEATDKAGNIATPQTIIFSVDQSKPEIRITGTDNYEQWKEPVNVQFTVEESYYANNNVEIKGTRTDIDGNVTDVALPEFSSVGKVSSLSQMFNQDGIYEFEVVSKDEAGNRGSGKIHFVIDQTNPQINNIEKFDGGYYQSFRLAESLEDIFKDLTVINYRILLNGIEYDGITPVEEEGKYTLDVEVSDELGHVTSRLVEFIIDHTAPKVIFTGAKDGETVHESGTITMSLTNAEDEITDVRMNGVHYDSDVRSLDYSEYGSYQIEVDCVDKAGNSITRSLYFVYNNPKTDFALYAGMSILAVSTCAWLWIRTRRKEREEKEHDKSNRI